MTHAEAEKLAIEAATDAVVANYDAARDQLSRTGIFGKELDRKARKLALRMGGFVLPAEWTIAMVTPNGWGSGGYHG